VVEIGPQGGDAGGEMLYQGNLAGLRTAKQSVTSEFLSV
jgi:excinuclease UvrABC ATPase subunit